MNKTSEILESIIENIPKERLPANWIDFDFESFSKEKRLYDFQQEALENVLKVLWFYYENSYDFRENEDLEINDLRKEKLFNEYLNSELNEREVVYKYKEERKHKFIFDYYPVENGEISFKHFINRAGFWMATGSGKTLVIIKLIEFLKELIKRKEIPNYDILFLTYRDDLIDQFKKHLEEFNKGRNNKINIYDFKNYEKIKRNRLFSENSVFYYKADLFSDEEKEKLVDFINYYNNGKWYLILDEAHKGDKEESKRQHIFSILSKNGFLFNFSATFDDIRDVVTTCFNYSLPIFIQEGGYGKKIYISDYELKAFKNKFDKESKQKIILKSLVLLTYIKKKLEKIREINSSFYHSPLMMVLVNSVNQEDADLKLFFDEMRNIAEKKFKEKLFDEVKEELKKELRDKKKYVIPKEDIFEVDLDLLSQIVYDDVLSYVFNSRTPGSIEISYNPSIKAEVAFKLKTSDSHFALMKTGDMPSWLKNSLGQFDVNHSFEDAKFFEKINREDSPINLLLGSRVFYEGWDSNRPNIIMFINIGVGKDAKKFVLQSIGRGIRIEPIKNEKKRIENLKKENKIDINLYKKIEKYIGEIESLFVFGTNKNTIEKIIESVNKISKSKIKNTISLFKNEKELKNKLLLIPKYKISKRLFEEDPEEKNRYSLNNEDFELLKEYNEFINDDRILLITYDLEPKLVRFFRNSFIEEDKYYHKTKEEVKIGNVSILVRNFFKYFTTNFEEFNEFSELKDEIKHFEQIKVELEDISKLKEKIELVRDYKEREKKVEESYRKISQKEYQSLIQDLKPEEEIEIGERKEKIKIKYIVNHYYIPVILSLEEKIEYIERIVKNKSEIEFIKELEEYIKTTGNKFEQFDWWFFSKLDENMDKEIYIPYWNYNENRLSKFIPDFIFWLQKGNEYYIVFVDPKGTTYRDFEAKIKGYKKVFEENNKPKRLIYKNLSCYVYCFLKTDNKDKVKTSGYKDYWFEKIEDLFKIL